jgi:hypothetical protein
MSMSWQITAAYFGAMRATSWQFSLAVSLTAASVASRLE